MPKRRRGKGKPDPATPIAATDPPTLGASNAQKGSERKERSSSSKGKDGGSGGPAQAVNSNWMQLESELDYAQLQADEVLKSVKGPLPEAIRNVERLAREFPSDKDFHFYFNFPEFKDPVKRIQAQVTSLLSEIGLAEKLLSQSSAYPDESDESYDWLVEIQDDLVEGIDTALDQFNKEKRNGKRGAIDVGSETIQSPRKLHEGSKSGESAHENVKIAKGKGSKERRPVPFHVRSIPWPQDKFDIAVDNSNTPFKHPQAAREKLGCKKEGASALELHARKLVGSFEDIHPFEELLNRLDYVNEALLESPAPQKPRPIAETPLTVVSTLSDLNEMGAKLTAAGEIAVDLEHHHYRSFQGFVCLMQVSTRSEDFIVDTLALRSHIGPCLGHIFADTSIRKVMHGADHDIVWLQRDFGIYVCNMFDTGQAARVLQMEGFGLAFLLQHFLNIHPDKRYQLADWRIRPLAAEMIKYAREDTHYLLYIYDMLRVQLVATRATAENDGDDALLQVYKQSRDVCLLIYKKEVLTETSYLNLYGLKDRGFNPQQMAVLASLYAWRDCLAREEDESTGYVLPNQLLLKLAEEAPDTSRKLHSLIRGPHSLVGQHAATVLELIRQSNEQAVIPAPLHLGTQTTIVTSSAKKVPLTEKLQSSGLQPHHNVNEFGPVPEFFERTDEVLVIPKDSQMVRTAEEGMDNLTSSVPRSANKNETSLEALKDMAVAGTSGSVSSELNMEGNFPTKLERERKPIEGGPTKDSPRGVSPVEKTSQGGRSLGQLTVSEEGASHASIDEASIKSKTILETKITQFVDTKSVAEDTRNVQKFSTAVVRRAAAPALALFGSQPRKRAAVPDSSILKFGADSSSRPSLLNTMTNPSGAKVAEIAGAVSVPAMQEAARSATLLVETHTEERKETVPSTASTVVAQREIVNVKPANSLPSSSDGEQVENPSLIPGHEIAGAGPLILCNEIQTDRSLSTSDLMSATVAQNGSSTTGVEASGLTVSPARRKVEGELVQFQEEERAPVMKGPSSSSIPDKSPASTLPPRKGIEQDEIIDLGSDSSAEEGKARVEEDKSHVKITKVSLLPTASPSRQYRSDENVREKSVRSTTKMPGGLGSMLGSSARRKATRPDEDEEMAEARLRAEQIRASVSLPFHRVSALDSQLSAQQSLKESHLTSFTSQSELPDTSPSQVPSSGDNVGNPSPIGTQLEQLEEFVMLESWDQEFEGRDTPAVPGNKHTKFLGREEELAFPKPLSEVGKQSRLGRKEEDSALPSDFQRSDASRRSNTSMETVNQQHSRKKKRKTGTHDSPSHDHHKEANDDEVVFKPFDYSAARREMGLEGKLSSREQDNQKPKGRGRGVMNPNKRQRQAPPPRSTNGTKEAFDPLRRVRQEPRPEGIPAAKRRQVFPQTGNRTATFRR